MGNTTSTTKTIVGFRGALFVILCSFLLFWGCLRDPIQVDTSYSEQSINVQLFQKFVGKNESVDFQQGLLRVAVPAGALKADGAISILRTSMQNIQFDSLPGFIPVSDQYEVKFDPEFEWSNGACRIEIPLDKSLLSSTLSGISSTDGVDTRNTPGWRASSGIFLVYRDKSGSVRLLTPQIDEVKNIATFDTYHFGRWVVARRPYGAYPQGLTTAPIFNASVALIIATQAPLLMSDLLLEAGFEVSSNARSLSAQMNFACSFIPLTYRDLEIADWIDNSQKRILTFNNGKSEAVSLFTDRFARVDFTDNAASSSLRIAFAGKPSSLIPEKLILDFLVTDQNNLIYEKEGEISFHGNGLKVELLAPVGVVDRHSLVFSWDIGGFRDNFTNGYMEVSPALGSFSEVILHRILANVQGEYTPTASEADMLAERQDLAWKLIIFDSQGKRIESPPLNFSVVEGIRPRVVQTDPLDFATNVNPSKTVTVLFDREMSAPSLESGFSISPTVGTTTFNWDSSGRKVNISFSTPLALSATYKISLDATTHDIDGNTLGKIYEWSFSTISATDKEPPKLLSITPSHGAIKVARNARLSLEFSEAMKKETVQNNIRVISPTVGTLTWLWSENADIVSVLPENMWAASSAHEISIGSGCADVSGNTLAASVKVSFTTSASFGAQISSTVPVNHGVVDGPVNQIVFIFDSAMDKSSAENGFSVFPQPSGTPDFSWSQDAKTLTISWPNSFPEGITITASFSAGIHDTANRPLTGETSLIFSVNDKTPPTVTSFFPASGATGLPVNTPIWFQFGETMDRNSVETAISASPSFGVASFTWNESGTKATFSGKQNWPPNSRVFITLDPSARDRTGNKMGSKVTFFFETQSGAAPTITQTHPGNGETRVSRSSTVSIDFSQAMNTASVESALAISPSPPISPSLSWNADHDLLTIDFSVSLANATVYTVQIGTNAKNSDDIALNLPYSFSFTTIDTIPPVMIRSEPNNGQTQVAINGPLLIVFDEPIDQESASAAFSINPPLSGTPSFEWSDGGKALRVSWIVPFNDLTTYICRIASSLRDSAGNSLGDPLEFSFTTTDSTPPLIADILPSNQAIDVPRNTALIIRFNESMATSSVALNITPTSPSIIKQEWSDSDRTLTITFGDALDANRTYNVVVSTLAADIFGNRLSGANSFLFTVGSSTAPSVTVFTPYSGATDVATSTKLNMVFDRSMDASSVKNSLSIIPLPPSTPVFSWSSDTSTLELSFLASLNFETTYQVIVSTGARDLNKVTLTREFNTAFTTELSPRVVTGSEFPLSGAVNIATSTAVFLTFSKDMDKTSTNAAFALCSQGESIAGTISWLGRTMTFLPSKFLFPNRSYTSVVAATARDLRGNTLQQAWNSTFQTAPNLPPALSATIPAAGAVDVEYDSPIIIRFSGKMATPSVSVDINPTPRGDKTVFWSNDDTTINYYFTGGFESEKKYQVSVGTVAADIFGNALTGNKSFEFTARQILFPRIVAISPASGASDVVKNSLITLTFSQPVDQNTVQGAISFNPMPSGVPAFSWSSDGMTITISFSLPFDLGRTYSIDVSTAAKNLDGIAMTKPFTSIFTTEAPPVVVNGSEYPASGTPDVATDTKIRLIFSKTMDHNATQNAFSLTSNGTPVFGTFAWSGSTLEFSPASELAASSTCIVSVSTAALDSNGNSMSSAFAFSFTTRNLLPPAVVVTNPLNGATNVAFNSPIAIEFSRTMATETIVVNISPAPSGSITKTWSNSDKNLVITSLGGWESETSYTATLNASAKDIFGIPLAVIIPISFTIEKIITPKISSFEPTPGATDVPVSGKMILSFSRTMATSTTEEAFSLAPTPSANPAFSWTNNDTRLEIGFSIPLLFDKMYEATVSTQAQDVSGIKLLTPFCASFTTESAPAVVAGSEYPAPDAAGVATNSFICIGFNKEMNQTSVESAFSVSADYQSIPGIFQWNANVVTFTPTSSLPASSSIIVVVADSAKDSRGNKLPSSWGYKFTTVQNPPLRIVQTFPLDHEINVGIQSQIVLTFNNPVNTVPASVSVIPTPLGSKGVSWSGQNKVMAISYSGGYESGKTYQVLIDPLTSDIYGSRLETNVSFQFTVETVTAPRVLNILPSPGTIDVPRTATITFSFDHQMNETVTQNAFSIYPNPAVTQFSWSATGTVLTASFPNFLEYSTPYVASISTYAADLGGISLFQPYSTAFTTEARPQVVSGGENPNNNSVNVATETSVSLTFSREMNHSVTENAFQLLQGTVPVSGTFTWNAATMVFTPSSPLTASTVYFINVNTSARDIHGNTFGSPFNSKFTTIGLEGSIWRLDLVADAAGSQFSQRSRHSLASFSGYLWLIGGNDGAYLNDVWRSSNGTSWTQVLANNTAPGGTRFLPRADHNCLVFNGKLWVVGGEYDTGSGIDYFDDVWWSADGTSWNLATGSAAFWARGGHSMAVFQNKMWMFGGTTLDQDGNPLVLGDTWVSADGVNWSEKGAIVNFFPRRHSTAGVINNKMWIWGGYGKDAQGIYRPLNDVWSSSDGNIWARVSEHAAFPGRYGATVVPFNGKYWLIGGAGLDSGGWEVYRNDVWSSGDGATWTKIVDDDSENSAHFSRRVWSSSGILNGRIFLVGGDEVTGSINDVWSTN